MAEKTMAAQKAAIACEALYHIPANSHSRWDPTFAVRRYFLHSLIVGLWVNCIAIPIYLSNPRLPSITPA